MKRALVLFLALAVATCAFASVAHADYKVGSKHPLLTKRQGLALPLPRAAALPKVTKSPSGRLRVSATMRYRAANWKGEGKAARDRATVVIAVARRMLASGPYRGSEVFRKAIRHRLTHRKVKRRYSVLLPAKASRLLVKWGALSKHAHRRAQALRRVTVDVQVDRDFRRVDGHYDWREGGAWSAADGLLARLRSKGRGAKGRVELSSYREPYGTLTLINNTAAGVYCQNGCPLTKEDGEPGALSGTSDSNTYRVPIAVGGGPVQCFDQGSNGSDPEGFANFNAAGEPQPYQAGELLAPSGPDAVVPNTTGTAVTEGLAADYDLSWASEDELADETGLIMGSAKLGAVVAGATIKTVATGAVAFPSPGAVITDVLGVFEFFLKNSCKEAGNYFNITGTESNGGTFSQTIEAKNESWREYPGTGDTPYGTQYNPSLLGYESHPLRLNPIGAFTPGLADNACLDCSENNVVAMSWNDYNPCPDGYNCAAEPPASPIVTNSAAELDCGNGNQRCPFPAAGFPKEPKPVFLGLSNGELLSCNATRSHDCKKLDDAGDNSINSLTLSGGKLWAGISNGVAWECLPEVANECGNLNQSSKHNGTNTVVHEQGRAFAGGSDGIIESCIEGTDQGCFNLDETGGDSINALVVLPNGELVAGRHDGVLWQCRSQEQNRCFQLDDASSAIYTLAQMPGEKVLAGIADGVIWECPAGNASSCKTLAQEPEGIESIVYANGHIFAGYEGPGDAAAEFYRCTPGQSGCEVWAGGWGRRFAAVGERLYVAGAKGLQLCSTVKRYECKTLDTISSGTIESIAVTGETYASQP